MSNGDPDFSTLTRQVAELGRRMTNLETARKVDQQERRSSETATISFRGRMESRLNEITDTDNPRSLVSKMDDMKSLMDQAKGILNVLRWLGAGATFSGIGALVWVALHTAHP